jgi:hypothetical protein
LGTVRGLRGPAGVAGAGGGLRGPAGVAGRQGGRLHTSGSTTGHSDHSELTSPGLPSRVVVGVGTSSKGFSWPPVGRSLHARAWTVRREGHRWYVAGEMTLASTGVVLARGEAAIVLRDLGHFARHREWLAQQDRDDASA